MFYHSSIFVLADFSDLPDLVDADSDELPDLVGGSDTEEDVPDLIDAVQFPINQRNSSLARNLINLDFCLHSVCFNTVKSTNLLNIYIINIMVVQTFYDIVFFLNHFVMIF